MTINLTDPANHPANGPLTAERIERVRDELQRSIQYQNGGDMACVIADAIKGLEELLVSKEAASKPVGNEELDQMIWKLERDGGMTPKLLSLMRELREVRKAATEPAIIVGNGGDALAYRSLIQNFAPGTKLYTAPPAPVTPDGWREEAKRLAELHGCSFVVFRHGEESQCADPTKVIISFTDKGLGYSDSDNFRGNVNSSTKHFRENEEASTNCPKCGGRGMYYCPQMLGTVECECTFPAALRREVSGRIQEGRAQSREEMVMGSRLTRHRFKP